VNCSDVITGYLEAAGIKHIFGYPGDPSVELLETARRNGIEFVLARREGTAGLMAAAYGQITGVPASVCRPLGRALPIWSTRSLRRSWTGRR